jgi:hypothetical protein
LIKKEILETIEYDRETGCSLTGPDDLNLTRLNVWKGE